MRALSGLTPALSRRLQRQLLAHLPPAAARQLRRTLSLRDAPAPAPVPAPAPAPASAPATPAAPPDPEPGASLYCTLPRPRRRSPSAEPAARERPRLSKYLTPERALSLDDAYGSDGGSAASDSHSAPAGSRRSSLRAPASPAAPAERPRRKPSRFLRDDFFDDPPDDDPLARQRRERELETQKILREIREKRNRAQAAALAAEEASTSGQKSPSPLGALGSKDRSRSTTPFFPILDNIKETAIDVSASTAEARRAADSTRARPRFVPDEDCARESRLVRPKSYPVKTLDSIEEPNEAAVGDGAPNGGDENKDRISPRESRLIRPKSYPASSPSPEKAYVGRAIKKEDSISKVKNEDNESKIIPTKEAAISDSKTDVEVSFNITLPRRPKPETITITEPIKNGTAFAHMSDAKLENDTRPESSLLLKKYQVIINDNFKSDTQENKVDGETLSKKEIIPNGGTSDGVPKLTNGDSNIKPINQSMKKDEVVTKTDETDQTTKKTVKKKIIRKVSSKSKTDLGSSQETGDGKTVTDKKKVTKKVKDKLPDDDNIKPTVTKKKSVLQSIGHKLEKFTSSKSNSPEKNAESNGTAETKKERSKLNRMQREQSVPVNAEPTPTTESKLIKRAVTLTDVAALDTQSAPQNKTTVSKVLGLFKKFEPKEKKPLVEKFLSENLERTDDIKNDSNLDSMIDSLEKDKPRRPTSLLLNGLGRKSKYERTSSDSVSNAFLDNESQSLSKKENESKHIRNSLKLDFSRLPRVKKIVPSNPVIEPQIMSITSVDCETEKKDIPEKNVTLLDLSANVDSSDAQSRSRSRSRSTVSNSEIKSDLSADARLVDRNPLSPTEGSAPHLRSRDSTTPEKEDIVDRIRRKSFYSRFNEKKQRRKSSLVGPGAAEYDPVARIHGPDCDVSPSSPRSPGLSAASDLSPCTERYRSLLADLPASNRTNLRFDAYGLNDKIDTYRSLDRNDFRKYSGNRSYLDYDQPLSYGAGRYSRTKSLLDGSDGTEDNGLVHSLRDPHRYNRTLSMYTPGNYATYRPNRTTRNSAIILKESEKEPSPENILEKIRQRKKISISVTRKPDPEKEPLPRSNIASKGEGDGAECSEKVN